MIRRKPYLTLFTAAAAATLSFTACEDEDNIDLVGNWIEVDSEFPGTKRGGAVCFVIDDVAYVGTGANTNRTEDRERYRDFYACSIDQTSLLPTWSARWERTAGGVSSMPDEAAARNGAVAFSINGKGYVGLGYDGSHYLRDFWEFDPNGTPDTTQYPSLSGLYEKFGQTGKWTRIADYPGDSCRYACAFVIDNVAYVGTGEDYDDNILSDFYRFDGENWTAISSIGHARAQASTFTYGGYGYVVGGVSSSSVDWFQRYDPVEDKWESLRRIADRTDYEYDDEYSGLAGYGRTAFVLSDQTDGTGVSVGPKAYITTGGSGGGGVTTWEYDLTYDYWVQKTSFEGSARKFAVSFVLEVPGYGQRPFVTTGCSSELTVTGSGGSFYSDMWTFNPFEPYEDID